MEDEETNTSVHRLVHSPSGATQHATCVQHMRMLHMRMLHMQHAACATTCSMCNNMQHVQQHAAFATCSICNMQHLQHAAFATCSICSICNMQHTAPCNLERTKYAGQSAHCGYSVQCQPKPRTLAIRGTSHTRRATPTNGIRTLCMAHTYKALENSVTPSMVLVAVARTRRLASYHQYPYQHQYCHSSWCLALA